MADTNSVAELEAPDTTVVLSDESEQENVEADESEDTESEKEEVTETQDEPETLDEGKYWETIRKEYQLPDDLKDFGSFVARHKAMVAEMSRTKPPVDKKPEADEKPFFAESPAIAKYKEYLAQQRFASEADQKYYAGVAEFMDSAFGGELKKHAGVLLGMKPAIMGMMKRLQALEWNGLRPEFKKNFKREDVEQIMEAHNFDDYETAIKHSIHTQRPELLDLIYKQVREDGAKEERQKQRLVQRSSPRGGAPQQEKTGFWKQFLDRNGEVNRERLMKLAPKERDRILGILEKNGY